MHGPKPLPGLGIIAAELDRNVQINCQLEARIQELELKISELERVIESYRSSSGTNN